jgi:hypothetical protein
MGQASLPANPVEIRQARMPALREKMDFGFGRCFQRDFRVNLGWVLRVSFRFHFERSTTMHRIWMTSMALAVVACGVLVAAELQSGLQVGDHAGPFNVKDITGPNKGKSLCYR